MYYIGFLSLSMMINRPFAHFRLYVIKYVSDLLTGRWFSPGTPVSSTNKTDHHDIAEILLNVALNTITITISDLNQNYVFLGCYVMSLFMQCSMVFFSSYLYKNLI